MIKTKIQIKTHMILMVILIISGLVLGILGLSGKNIVSLTFGDYSKFIYLLVGISAIIIATQRDTYLPFLGQAAIPCGLMPERVQKHTTKSIKLKIKPNTKVIYWAAEPGKDYTKHAYQAYDKVKNAGVSISDNMGNVELKFNYPQGYYVGHWGVKKNIPPHVHYRECRGNLMVGPVRSVML